MELEELFRKTLENSEINPDEELRSRLMKRVIRKEFTRFTPARFNIYYLGGIIAAGVTATFLLTHLPGKAGNRELQPRQEIIINADTTVNDTVSISQSLEIIRPDNLKPVQPSGVNAGNGSRNNPETKTPVKVQGITGNPVDQKELPGIPEKKDLIKDNLTKGEDNFALLRKPVASFDVSSSTGCPPFQVRFVNNSSGYDSCRWSFGDGGYSVQADPEWTFRTTGEYRVRLTVYGNGSDQASASEVINVHSKPVARYEISPESPILPDDEIRFTNYSIDAVRFRWEFGDGTNSDLFEPTHKYDKYKSYNVKLIVWSENGCSDTLLVRDAFASSGSYLEFPNAFIPNPDGPAGGYYSSKSDEAAQIFHPVTSGVSEYHLRIFSKIGVLIFESNDISIGWDGYNKGQLCEPGVYIWKVTGVFKNGEPFSKMGDVTVLRR
jgi:PKD repeat protein